MRLEQRFCTIPANFASFLRRYAFSPHASEHHLRVGHIWQIASAWEGSTTATRRRAARCVAGWRRSRKHRRHGRRAPIPTMIQRPRWCGRTNYCGRDPKGVGGGTHRRSESLDTDAWSLAARSIWDPIVMAILHSIDPNSSEPQPNW